jgi:hypothetical protein
MPILELKKETREMADAFFTFVFYFYVNLGTTNVEPGKGEGVLCMCDASCAHTKSSDAGRKEEPYGIGIILLLEPQSCRISLFPFLGGTPPKTKWC